MASTVELPTEHDQRAAAATRYGWRALRHDAIAGLTVAAIATPQAMAYALIAGVEPQYGLYAAIVVTAVGSVFGSSNFLINGPTNAISLVTFSALAFLNPKDTAGIAEALFLLAAMVGLIQIAIALFRLGDLTRYISESVVLGFMAGAGLLIALSQIGNLFGLKEQGNGRQHLLHRLWETVQRGGPVNPRAVAVGLSTTIAIILLRSIVRKYRLPRVDMLLVLIGAAAVTHFLHWTTPDGDGKLLLAVVGKIPSGFPGLHVPGFDGGLNLPSWQRWASWCWSQCREMGGSAAAISLLGLLEALAIAKSLAIRSRQPLDFNKQCLAEGMANLTGGFFQCMPGSGSLTRSAINYQAGAVSRWSGVFSAAATAGVLMALAPLANYIPKAALGGILLVTAAGLVDWARLRYAIRTSRYDAILVLGTALSAVFLSVEFAIMIGVLLSFVMYVPRAARLNATELTVGTERMIRELKPGEAPCTGLVVFDLEGELFFGVSPELEQIFERLEERVAAGARVVVLRLKGTRNPDMVSMKLFEQFIGDMQRHNAIVLLAAVRDDFNQAMNNLGFDKLLPKDHIFFETNGAAFSSTIAAVRYGYELLGPHSCPACAARNKRNEPDPGALHYMI
jgi:SulP family sulfate permease